MGSKYAPLIRLPPRNKGSPDVSGCAPLSRQEPRCPVHLTKSHARVVLACAVILIASLALIGVSSHRPDHTSTRVASTPKAARGPRLVLAGPYATDPGFGEQAVTAFLAGIQRDQDAAEAAAEEARNRATPAPTVVRAGSGCCGPHSDAWWTGVAQCEQGGRNDPYFGYFSFMDGSAGGKSWAEQVAMGNALLARAGREIGPWAAACVAAGYNASPGG